LARSGFVRYGPDRLDWPLSPAFHVWLRLHPRRRGGHLAIEPLIGIHAVEVERLWTAIKSGPYRAAYRRHVPTLAWRLASLAPEEQPFLMAADEPDRAVVDRLVAFYRTTGLPHARRLASLRGLEPLLARRITALDGNPERYAACLLLQGRGPEALSFVSHFAAGHPHYFSGFASPFAALARAGTPVAERGP
jgi:hypothetical protein